MNMNNKIISPSLDNPFCFEILNTNLDLEQCLKLLNESDWFSYENFNKDYQGYYGIGLTGFENTENIELDSLTIFQKISRKSNTDEQSINWQRMSTRTKNVRGVLSDFFDKLIFEPQRARFSKIDPGKSIPLHKDELMSNMTRVHWPLYSLPGNIFFNYNESSKKIDRYFLKPKHCYAINTNLLHGIINKSSEPRIHLIINFNINFEELKNYSCKGLFYEKV
jgi:hypothetical protein